MAAPALRVLERQARIYRRTWRSSVVTSFLNPMLYLLAMGAGLGALVDRGPEPAQLPGGSYLAFVATGLLAATAMQTGAGDSSWPVMAGIRWVKSYHAAMATPIRPRDIVDGHLAWVAVRLLLVSTVFAVVLVAFAVAPPAPALLAVLPSVLTGLAFAGPVMAYAATLRRETGLAALFRFGIVPMFLFSGTFFPVGRLPDAVEPLAAAVPLWHGVQLVRAAALAAPTAWPAAAHVAYLVVVAAAGVVASRVALERRLVT